MLKNLLKSQRGQGMTEYVVVVALMALASIAVIGLYGDGIQLLFGKMTYTLIGTPPVSINSDISAKGEKAVKIGNDPTTLANVGQEF